MTTRKQTPREASARERYLRYVVVPWAKSPRGMGPDLPKDVGFHLLAEPSNNDSPFGLFRIDVVPASSVPAAEPVSETLDTLLNSAERYPPALGLLWDAIKHREGELPSRARFLWRVERLVARYLAEQPSAPYFLARSRIDEIGYRGMGGWYWLVSYSRSTGRVSWVSSDTIVYADSAATFDVELPQLERLPAKRVLHWPDDDEVGPA
ncbi:MAG: hypothetical protein K8T90_20290 [Planctomycetes bacterium]|nr:hypothetical protein [Planctomycetota bacterium]